MKIMNVMLGRGLGGLEQASIDYAAALKHMNHDVIAVIDPLSPTKKSLEELGVQIQPLKQFGNYDIFAKRRLRKMVKDLNIQGVIVHGGRAATLMQNVSVPVVGVSHTYNTKRLMPLDGIMAITNYMRENFIQQGRDPDDVIVIPNMIETDQIKYVPRPYHSPPVIGAMGRFIPRKGLDVFLQALAILQANKIPFKGLIVGQGPEENSLRQLQHELGLEDSVQIKGWANPAAFHAGIDIFALPSFAEPFGIVLLEAWAMGTPVVAANSEGPAELITPDQDAILVDIKDAKSLAHGLKKLLENPELANKLVQAGREQIAATYNMPAVAKKLDQAVHHFFGYSEVTFKR